MIPFRGKSRWEYLHPGAKVSEGPSILTRRAVSIARRSDCTTWELTPRTLALLIIAHSSFGPIFLNFALFGQIHAIITGIVALRFVLLDPRPDRTFIMIGYFAGAEVLWRMSGGAPVYMYPEYMIILLSLIAGSRFQGERSGGFIMPLYFVFLLPSIVMSFLNGEFAFVKDQVAFNLSAPLALAVGVFTFSKYELSSTHFQWNVFAVLLPILSVLFTTIIAVHIVGVHYTSVAESNIAASGGFGPNQVSNILSYGAALAIMLAIFPGTTFLRFRPLFILIALLCFMQGIFTLSRGGPLNFIGFLVFTLFFGVVSSGKRLRFLVTSSLLIWVFFSYILPWMDDYSGGAIERRMEDRREGERFNLMQEELRAFMENPIFGTGPGGAKEYRIMASGRLAASHTEYTRLIAEHGIFGILALLSVIVAFVSFAIKCDSNVKRGIILGSSAWVMIYFSHSGTRIVAFALLAIQAAVLANTRNETKT